MTMILWSPQYIIDNSTFSLLFVRRGARRQPPPPLSLFYAILVGSDTVEDSSIGSVQCRAIHLFINVGGVDGGLRKDDNSIKV